MANPTSNFNWQMPTSSDLVTDLPADFEVFGQAVDTSLADLKGGTTGQVLKKNSNTDMDFVWSADAAGMTNPMTTTGDTIYSSSGSTPARLGIGSTGNVLTVSGGVPVWSAPAPANALTLLDTMTLSGSSVTSATFSSSYKYLKIYYREVFGSADTTIRMRLNGDTATKYAWQAAVAGGGVGDVTTQIRIGYMDTSTDVLYKGYGTLEIFRPSDTDLVHYSSITNSRTGGAGIGWFSVSGVYDSSAAITNITLFPATGTFSGGTVYIYGVN
jgi:hypothetical protein